MKEIIRLALKEDIGKGDITSMAVIPAGTRAKAKIIAKEKGIVAGIPAAKEVFSQLSKSGAKAVLIPVKTDGDRVRKGDVIALVKGDAAAILAGERTALNFLQRLSGIATLTSLYVNKVRGTKAKILDTRKTCPGMRDLEKAAVKAAGGCNHRMGLYDAVLIKDNHIAAAGGVAEAVRKIKRPGKIEIEAKTIIEVRQALQAGAGRILLDNMTPKALKNAVRTIRDFDRNNKKRTVAEASGGVSLKTVAGMARAGVDFISVGAVTHSAKALDISLKITC